MKIMRTKYTMAMLFVGGVVSTFWATNPGMAQQRPATTVPGRIVHAPAPSADGQLKILVYHDMEGLTNQADPRTYRSENPDQYAYGRELLMADLNAVIYGLFAGGADSVFVVDGHGSGSAEPDIITEKLDPRAIQIFRDEYFFAYSGYPVLSDVVPPGTYHAVVLVGSHGKTGGEGFVPHTTIPNWLPHLNGESVGEAELLALAWGRHHVPLIFVSGDDQLEKEISESLPWIEYVVTKRSRNTNVVELLPADEVRAELRERARVAASQWMEMKAVTLTKPVHVKIETFEPVTLEPLRGVPGITFDGDMLTFVAADFQETQKAMLALLFVAMRFARVPVLWEPRRGERGYHGAL